METVFIVVISCINKILSLAGKFEPELIRALSAFYKKPIHTNSVLNRYLATPDTSTSVYITNLNRNYYTASIGIFPTYRDLLFLLPYNIDCVINIENWNLLTEYERVCTLQHFNLVFVTHDKRYFHPRWIFVALFVSYATNIILF